MNKDEKKALLQFLNFLKTCEFPAVVEQGVALLHSTVGKPLQGPQGSPRRASGSVAPGSADYHKTSETHKFIRCLSGDVIEAIRLLMITVHENYAAESREQLKQIMTLALRVETKAE